MPRTPIRLAILGCGFAAQQIHIPRLVQMPDSFKIVRWPISNPQPPRERLNWRAAAPPLVTWNKCWIQRSRRRWRCLRRCMPCRTIEIALRRGVDVFAEKPLCETPADARRLAAADRRAAASACRRRDARLTRQLQLTQQIVGRDQPAALGRSARLLRRRLGLLAGGELVASQKLQAGLPVRAGFQKNLLQSLLLEFIHDISILRGVFGEPLSVPAAHALSRRLVYHRRVAATGRYYLAVCFQRVRCDLSPGLRRQPATVR